MSIDPMTGKGHCFSCGIRLNFQSYYKTFMAGSSNNPDSYTDFIIDFLNLSNHISVPVEIGPDYEAKISAIRDQVEEMKTAYRAKHNKDFNPNEVPEKTIVELPKENLTKWNQDLLNNPEMMKYLWEHRHVDEKVVKKYMLGAYTNQYGYKSIVFPQIDAEGNLVNAKLYNPMNPKYKWQYLQKGNPTKPSPMNNFMNSKIYFFEGEPDCYCAIGFGLNAVTLGPAVVTDVCEVFGAETAKMLFTGKECVICFDGDDAGKLGASKLAKSLYPFAKQIKIIDLNKSDTNPYGLPLDEEEVETPDGKKKMKRVYKDMSDFMMKINGGGDDALIKFNELVDDTCVYVENDSRSPVEVYKVTLQESRNPKYHSVDGTKELELIAAVSEFDPKSFLYPVSILAICPCLSDSSKLQGKCKNCSLSTIPTLGVCESVEFFLDRRISKENRGSKFHIELNEHEILGLIQVTETQKNKNLRKLCGLHDWCSSLRIIEKEKEKLINVKLSKDIDEQQMSDAGSAEIDIEAYMMEKDIYANRSYLFRGNQTTAWEGQHAVLFLHKAEPIMTSVESYKNDEESIAVLRALQPKDGDTVEGIEKHLKLRYDILGNAAGISGRSNLLFANDLVFFSQAEISIPKLLPSIRRGFVEWLICGDTRCGKTVISKFLHKHYHIGEMIGGSNAISRSGLIGGVEKGTNSKKSTICWGKIPMNDNGLIIIDELSNIDTETLSALTACRSEGIVEIGKIRSGKAQARTRKIMLSNDPDPTAQSGGSRATEGMPLLIRICRGKFEILARFDGSSIVKRDDVPYEDFNASYEQVQTMFTEYQEHRHIMFTWSRTLDQVVYEEGIEEHINKAQEYMLSKFHASTQLVNQEMRAKLVRLSVALAGILVSTKDFERIYVKKVHVDYIVKFLEKEYSSKNMNLDTYSKIQIQSEVLGDMRFMENIMKYVDLYAIMNIEEVNEMAMLHIFNDYVQRVAEGRLSIVDAMNDNSKSSGGMRPIDVLHKLVGVMVTRNCLIRTRYGRYRKSSMFDRWLNNRLEMGKNANYSNILEPILNKRNTEVDQAIERLNNFGRPASKQSTG